MGGLKQTCGGGLVVLILLAASCGLDSDNVVWGLTRSNSGHPEIVMGDCETDAGRTLEVSLIYMDIESERRTVSDERTAPEHPLPGLKATFRVPCDLCILDLRRPDKRVAVVQADTAYLDRVNGMDRHARSQTELVVWDTSKERPFAPDGASSLLSSLTTSTVVGGRLNRSVPRDDFCDSNR